MISHTQKLKGFESEIWNNISQDILLRLNPELGGINIKQKNLAELTTKHIKLLDVALSPNKYIVSYTIHNFKRFLIDLDKYLLIESKGGILTDLNFRFSEQFNSNNSYDLMATQMGLIRLENSFFIAKPPQPTFADTFDIIKEMIFTSDCALQELRDSHQKYNIISTEVFSMIPLVMTYICMSDETVGYDGMGVS
jgi:hypothetical protein